MLTNPNALSPVFDDLTIEDDFDLGTLAAWEEEVYDLDPTGGSASRY